MTDTEMSRLERKYRSALRLLPAGYRALWADEMVATFLDSVQTDDPDQAEDLADFGRPSWSELASVAALAVRLRLGTAGGVPARYLAWGAALRLVALMLLLSSSVFGTLEVVGRLWLAGVLRRPGWAAGDWATVPLPAESWRLVLEFGAGVWPLAYLALVAGQRRTARWLALLATLLTVARMVEVHGVFPRWLLAWNCYLLLLDGLVLFALAAFGRGAPRLHPLPWLLASGVGVAVGYAALVGAPRDPAGVPLLDLYALACIAVTATGVLWLVGPRRGWVRRRAAWPHALAIVCVAIAGQRVLILVGYAQTGLQNTASLTLGMTEVGAALAVGVALTVQAGRALRRLPTPAEAGSWSTGAR